MTVILIIAGVLAIVGVILWLFDRLSRTNEPESDSQPVPESDNSQCCGMHITCEKDSLLASVNDKAEYFDDEELDRFAGRDADSYTEQEVEEFRDILLTLLPDDIAPWARSIQLRSITLPPVIRQELLMIVAEARAQHAGQ
ncbi:MAG: phospholipase [Muribaculum sp.]|nr:phospholipase [Muribaculaceae bacterium]MCM1080266.1 phospholipase [Muribaculum sp.]